MIVTSYHPGAFATGTLMAGAVAATGTMVMQIATGNAAESDTKVAFAAALAGIIGGLIPAFGGKAPVLCHDEGRVLHVSKHWGVMAVDAAFAGLYAGFGVTLLVAERGMAIAAIGVSLIGMAAFATLSKNAIY